MSNEELYQAAVDAINRLFSDQSVSRRDAKANLKNLRDEIDVLLDCLD